MKALLPAACLVTALCTATHATPPPPVPLSPGAPMYYTAGNDVGWQPIVPPTERLLSREEADAAIRNRSAIAAKEGLTALENYLKWWLCEMEPGKWDFSYYDLHANAAREAGIRIAPMVVAGPAYATPPWFKASTDSLPARCLEDGMDTATQSIWNPKMRPRVTEFLRRMAEHYGDEIFESLKTGISGDFGEAIYTAGGNTWTYLDSPYHYHQGYWCGDPYARADFRRSMTSKYKTIAKLNAAWHTGFISFDDVDPFLPNAAPNRRARLDMQRWYCGSMTSFLEFWLQETRRFFPRTRILVSTGGDGSSILGADFAAQAKVAAKYKAGLRITNEASDYAANYMLTRQVTTACRFYGTYSGIEPAGAVSTDGIVGRIYNATASGADELFTYDPEPSGERGDRYREFKPFMVKRKPSVDVGYFLNRTSWDLGSFGLYWDLGQRLRSVTDFDILDDRLITEGALKGKRVLVWADGPIVEATTAQAIHEWVRTGGILLLRSGKAIETVEGKRISWLPTAITDMVRPSTRYRIDVGSAPDESGLEGTWCNPEALPESGPSDRTFRWTTDGSEIRLKIPGSGDVTVALGLSAGGPAPQEQFVTANGVEVGRIAAAGPTTMVFHLTKEQLQGKRSIDIAFPGRTWPADPPDSRRLGVQVYWAAVGVGNLDASDLQSAPIPGYADGITLKVLADAGHTLKLGRGAIVYLPASNLPIDDAAREVIYNPGRFVPGARAPYAEPKSDGQVFLTRFTDGNSLFLNMGSSEAAVSYAGSQFTVQPHSIHALPKAGATSAR